MIESFLGFSKKDSRDGQNVPELREKLCDPSFLPTYDEVISAFESDDDFEQFCRNKENPVYEFLTQDFINALGSYISNRAAELEVSDSNPLVILEVGAGNGRLTHFLQQKLDVATSAKIKVVAVDSGEWELKSAFPVEKLGHKEALEKYQPKIVVFSWMPYGYDCTDDFRAADSVQEYILIGESGGGCCGNKWLTWGNDYSWDDNDEKRTPPHEVDGFEQEYLGEISEKQICRTDYSGMYSHSSTISFKRKK